MLTEFILSFIWLAVAFVLSTQILLTEFRRIDCVHTLFESTRAELERRGRNEMNGSKKSIEFENPLPDFNLLDRVVFRETPETLEGSMHCPKTQASERVVLRKLK